jgi:hypothetical protein
VTKKLWQEAVEAWEVERANAKDEKRKVRWKKPVLKGALLMPIPRPVLPADEGAGR